MPIFEYKCNACNHTFEQLVFISNAEAPACPECSSRDVQKLISAGAIRPNGIPTGKGGFNPPPCKASASG